MKKVLLLFFLGIIGMFSQCAFGQDEPINKPQVMPEFQGGESLSYWLQTHVSYPAEALERNEHGRVLVSFVVEADGSLSSFKVVKSVSPLLDAEALRIAKTMPPFRPGYNDGRPCRVQYLLPVNFKTDDGDVSSEHGQNHERKVYLIEKNRVASIALGKAVSEVPDSIDGLYDSKHVTVNEIYNIPLLILYYADEKVMEIVCADEDWQHDIQNGNISCVVVYSPNLSLSNGIHTGLGISDLIDKYHAKVCYINRGIGDFEGNLCVVGSADGYYRLDLKGSLTQKAMERFERIKESGLRNNDGCIEMPVTSSDILEGVVESISVFYKP